MWVIADTFGDNMLDAVTFSCWLRHCHQRVFCITSAFCITRPLTAIQLTVQNVLLAFVVLDTVFVLGWISIIARHPLITENINGYSTFAVFTFLIWVVCLEDWKRLECGREDFCWCNHLFPEISPSPERGWLLGHMCLPKSQGSICITILLFIGASVPGVWNGLAGGGASTKVCSEPLSLPGPRVAFIIDTLVLSPVDLRLTEPSKAQEGVLPNWCGGDYGYWAVTAWCAKRNRKVRTVNWKQNMIWFQE